MTDSDDFFAAPPFDPAQALPGLKRQLRDLRLAERGIGYELKGRAVVEISPGDGCIDARLVKRPALTPEWQAHPLRNAADVRRFVETVKRQLQRWSDDA